MARLRPSAASRWVNCPGSVVLCEQYPEPEGQVNSAAEDGTAAHWGASEVLASYEGWTPEGQGLVMPGDLLGKVAPNGVVVTEEMVEAIQVYSRNVLAELQRLGGDSQLMVERPVDIHAVHPENSGTYDGAVFVANNAAREMILWDFKFGWGLVEPSGNWQLIDYAIGILEEWRLRGIPLPDHVELRIVQPRPYHPMGPVRSWKASREELGTYYQALRSAAEEAMGPSPRCIPGDHCKTAYCSARANCSALNKSVSWVQEIAEQPVDVNLSGDDLGLSIKQLRSAAKLVDALLSGREERALAQLKSGQAVPGWSVEEGKGRTRWKAGKSQEIISLGDMLGTDLRKKEAQLITPNQAAKAGIDSAVISSYTETPNTGVKLVPVESSNNLAKKVFNDE